MNYLVLKKCKHPITKEILSPGTVISLFHTIGDPHTKGEKPYLKRSNRSTDAQIIASKHVSEDTNPAKSK